MRLNASIPTENMLAELLFVDPLRSKSFFKKIEKQVDTDFCKDLIKRINCSRFDPRVMESLVERIVLFPKKMNLLCLSESFHEITWPRAFVSALDFSIHLMAQLHPKAQGLMYIKSLRNAFLKNLKEPLVLESFYIALYPPGSKRIGLELLGASKAWTNNGYWALSSPYSKELLARYAKSDQTLPHLSSSFALQKLKQVLSSNKGVYLTLAQIHEQCGMQNSRRQLLRYLSKMKIKKLGKAKDARYKAL